MEGGIFENMVELLEDLVDGVESVRVHIFQPNGEASVEPGFERHAHRTYGLVEKWSGYGTSAFEEGPYWIVKHAESGRFIGVAVARCRPCDDDCTTENCHLAEILEDEERHQMEAFRSANGYNN